MGLKYNDVWIEVTINFGYSYEDMRIREVETAQLERFDTFCTLFYRTPIFERLEQRSKESLWVRRLLSKKKQKNFSKLLAIFS